MVGYLPAVLIHAHGCDMPVEPAGIPVLVYHIGLVPVPHLVHIVPDEIGHLILRNLVRHRRIDGCMEGHFLRADTPLFIDFEGLHRVLRVGNLGGEGHRGLSLGNLLLVVVDRRGHARGRCVNLAYHCVRSMLNLWTSHSPEASCGASRLCTHTSRLVKVLSSFTFLEMRRLPTRAT